MRILFNNGVVDDYTLVLSKRNLDHIGVITNYSGLAYSRNMNAANELSFTVNKYNNGATIPLWNEIADLRLVWVKELDEYFEIQISMNESTDSTKAITGTSLCEAELSQTILRGLEINTEEDIERDDYDENNPRVFYKPDDPDNSLLNIILEKAPHYSIGHVDESLMNLERVFSIDGTSIYDFMTGECAEQFDCLFTFDSATRTINAYDLYTVCEDCGYRGDFSDVCPKCGSKKLKYYGKDTSIFVGVENLTDEITYETDVDSIKNCFKLEAGDDLMTATVTNLNPNGSSYLYYFAEESLRDMSDELQEKLKSYDAKVIEEESQYAVYTQAYYDAVDNELEYQSKMMPVSAIQGNVTAETELAKLTADNLSGLALSNITTSTSLDTVNNAVKNWAKAWVCSGFVKIELLDTSWSYISGSSSGTWKGKFKVTNYSDEDDTKTGNEITLTVSNDYQEFINNKVIKKLQEDNDDKYDILSYDVVNLKGEVLDEVSGEYNLTQFGSWDALVSAFSTAIARYCYNRLSSFYDAFGAALDVLVQAGQGNDSGVLYDQGYSRIRKLQDLLLTEMQTRQATIDYWTGQKNTALSQMRAINKALNFENYLGEDLYNEFCMFRREDTYSNSNYVSDNLETNTELIKNAQSFIEQAKKDIVKSGEYQHSISSTLNNLLMIPEFEPLVDSFDVGNWIRFRVNDEIYRLRLIKFTIDFDNLQTISTEFSSLTKTAEGYNDVANILSEASSMATTYSYVAKQATNGEEAYVGYNNFINDGLDSALVNIKNNDHEEVIIDAHGLTCKTYDDITETYDDKQLRLTHNILAYTEDNWDSVKMAIGEHDYIRYDEDEKTFVNDTGYGVTAEFLAAGYIYGSQMISGNIYSDNYIEGSQGTHLNLEDGTFDMAGGKLTYDGTKLIISGNDEETTNLLRNINTTVLDTTTDGGKWADGKWRLSDDLISEEGAQYRQSISISVPARSDITNGWILANAETPTTVGIAQCDIAVTPQETYTLSCYVRGEGTFRLQIGNDSYYPVYFTIDDEHVWAKKEFTIYLDTKYCKDDVTNVYFTNYNSATEIQICGMALQRSQGTDGLMTKSEYCSSGTTTIDGGKLTTGSISTDKLTVGNGGNLYCLGYDTFEQITNDSLYLSKSAGVSSATIDASNGYYGNHSCKIVTSDTNTDAYIVLGSATTNYGRIPVQAGCKYIVSAYMKASISNVKAQLYCMGTATVSSSTTYVNFKYSDATLTTAWQRVQVVYTATSDAPYIYVRVDNDSASAVVWVDAIQIELCDNDNQYASAFSPAGTTTINGASILTGTISADAITANSIFTQTLSASDFNITGGSININSAEEKRDMIKLNYNTDNYNSFSYMAPSGVGVSASSNLVDDVDGSVAFGYFYDTTSQTMRGTLTLADSDADGMYETCNITGNGMVIANRPDSSSTMDTYSLTASLFNFPTQTFVSGSISTSATSSAITFNARKNVSYIISWSRSNYDEKSSVGIIKPFEGSAKTGMTACYGCIYSTTDAGLVTITDNIRSSAGSSTTGTITYVICPINSNR